MLGFMIKIQAYLACRKAATAVEYGLMAGGISLVIVSAVFLMGDSLETMFDAASSAMTSVAGQVTT